MGWMVPVYLLVAGYFVFRYRIRKHIQSLLIAGLMPAWPIAGALVVGLPSRPVALALVMAGALYGTLFLVVVADELRRRGKRGSP